MFRLPERLFAVLATLVCGWSPYDTPGFLFIAAAAKGVTSASPRR